MINKILLTILMFGTVCKATASERIIKLPEGVAERLKEIAQIQDTLPDVDYRFGWAIVKGHILDYHPGMVKEMTLLELSWLCPLGRLVICVISPVGL